MGPSSQSSWKEEPGAGTRFLSREAARSGGDRSRRLKEFARRLSDANKLMINRIEREMYSRPPVASDQKSPARWGQGPGKSGVRKRACGTPALNRQHLNHNTIRM